jgi:putative transposase
MALDQSALSELLDALRAGGDLDVVREGLALVLQAMIEAEAAEVIGAGRYERTASRTTHRNGSRARLLSAKALIGAWSRRTRRNSRIQPTGRGVAPT